jgi:hypothetical protein
MSVVRHVQTLNINTANREVPSLVRASIATPSHYGIIKKTYINICSVLSRLAIYKPTTNLASRLTHSFLVTNSITDLIKLDVPLWPYNATIWVENFLLSRKGKAKVFEWGTGASTVWLAKRAEMVISVDDNRYYADSVSKILSRRKLKNVNISVCERRDKHEGCKATSSLGVGGCFEEYVNEIRKNDRLYDLIIIDGRAREACIVEAVKKLTPGGIIFIDDSKRKRYKNVIIALQKDRNFTCKHFDGIPYGAPVLSRATIFKKRITEQAN